MQQHAVTRLANFTDQLETQSYRYDLEDWERAYNKFTNIRQDIARYDYTSEQSREIGRLEGRCYTAFVKNAGGGFVDRLVDLKDELKGILEGVVGAWNED